MYCENCRIQIEEGQYCPKCGERMTHTLSGLKVFKNSTIRTFTVGGIFLGICMVAFMLIINLTSSGSVKILGWIDAGKYEEAQKYYKENVQGKEQEEEELQLLLDEKISGIYNEFNNGILSYEDAINQAEPYLLYLKNKEEFRKYDFSALLASKESFQKGEKYFEDKNYKNAMQAYYEVIESDIYYADAQRNFDKCYDIIVDSSMIAADNAGQTGDYIEASLQLHEIENFIKEEDFSLFKERNMLYTERLKSYIEYAFGNGNNKSITYKDAYLEYDKIQNIEITDIVNNEDYVTIHTNVLLTDGLSIAEVLYEIVYVKDRVWQLGSVNVVEIHSITPTVYAVAKKETYGEKEKETTTGVYYVDLYNKEDDSLYQVLSTVGGLMYEYEYEDGKLAIEKYYDGRNEPVWTAYYNDKEQINSKIYNYHNADVRSESYSYDEVGNLLNHTMNNGWNNTIVTDYTYQNGLLINKKTTEDGVLDEEFTYHYDSNNFLIQMDYVNAFYDSAFYDTYYYQNDANGNVIDMCMYNDNGRMKEHIVYTYYENGEKKTETQYRDGTDKIIQTIYYDEQGRITHRQFSGASTYYEYDQQNRIIKEYTYNDAGEVERFWEAEYYYMTDEEFLNEYLGLDN